MKEVNVKALSIPVASSAKMVQARSCLGGHGHFHANHSLGAAQGLTELPSLRAAPQLRNLHDPQPSTKTYQDSSRVSHMDRHWNGVILWRACYWHWHQTLLMDNPAAADENWTLIGRFLN